ncbi:NAD(P)/FAD-dependent oxidoreductase [Halovivax limisalsi]|uniref:NAD(P)/FAD-dependent oxidoreductase n=1 Tax=Halovivax limisalsi TaxID=1453760 RepID=UPI001FFC7476|nr:FAD-dependent oxidoreductase [Halovivax limisalsi]
MHVVVLGGGYAGLVTTRRLERRLPSDVRLTLVNESPDHVLKHELHRVIRRPAMANAIRLSLPAVTDRARIHVATVESLDRAGRIVECSTGPIEYDYCVCCLGTATDYHGMASVRDRAVPLASSADALAIRSGYREALESAGSVRLVVGGAGLSGVQVAGELAALARAWDASDRTTVTLLERASTVAPGFPPRFAAAIREALDASGVRVEPETTVVGADDGAVETADGRSVPFDQLVWTGGIRGTDAQRGTRPTVGPALQLDRFTFGCGDAVRVEDATGDRVPASAQSARQTARTAAENVDRLVRHDRSSTAPPAAVDLDEFEWAAPGWAVSVGDDAVAIVGSRVVTGRPARIAKAAAGARHLAAVGAGRTAFELARTELASGPADCP